MKRIIILLLLIITSCQNEDRCDDYSYEKRSYDMSDITYVINDTMVLNRVNTVDLTISNGIKIEDIIDDIDTFTDDNVKTEKIRSSSYMQARLIDPTNYNFIITPITNEKQIIEDDGYTRWIWDVTPITKGNNKIHLSIDIIVYNKSKSVRVYDDIIYVYSDDTIFDKIIKFISNYWQWLISTLLIPLFIFLYKKIRN